MARSVFYRATIVSSIIEINDRYTASSTLTLEFRVPPPAFE